MVLCRYTAGCLRAVRVGVFVFAFAITLMLEDMVSMAFYFNCLKLFFRITRWISARSSEIRISILDFPRKFFTIE